MKNKGNTVKTISYVMLITLLGKVMALARESLLGRAYGTSMEANAFLAASLLPRVFFDAIFASAITMSFIPIFSKSMMKGGKKKAFEFSDTFITFVGVLMIILSGLGIVFSDFIAAVSVPEFSAQGQALTSNLLKILFPTLFFTGIAFSFIGILQSLDSFLIPALTSVVFNAVIILYFFGPDAERRIYGLAIVYLIGWILQAAIQVPSLLKKGYRFRLNFHWNNGYLKQVGMVMLPVLVSTWVQPLNIFVNTQFASGLYDGAAVTGINFANGLYTMIVGVFVLSIMNVIFPKMSAMFNQGEKTQVEKLTSQTLGMALLFVIPMMVGLMSVSREVIDLIYGGNKFDAFSVEITGQALFYFSLGMIGYALQTILARVYFAERNGKVPMIGAIIAIIVNILLCFLLAGPMGIGGLALASSISGTVYGVVLMIPLLSKKRQVFDKIFFVDLVKMCIASAIMAGGIAGLRPLLTILPTESPTGELIYLGLLVVCGVVLYAISALLLRIREIENIKDFLRNRKKHSKREKT